VLCNLALSAGSAFAAPNTVALPQFLQGKPTIHSTKVTLVGRDGFYNGTRVLRKGDAIFEGTVKTPVQFVSATLSVSALKILASQVNSMLYASKGSPQAAQVNLNGSFAPRSNKYSIRIEAKCDVVKLTKGVWILEGGVSGFYEDATGRKPLQGDIVKLSAFDNAISVVQDGVISLSDVSSG
jgi:hypothetical protein